MAKTSDWYPGGRNAQLVMARTWVTVLREDTAGAGSAAVKKYEAWGIPAAVFTEFVTLFAAAEETLRTAQEKETRTEVSNAACRAAFTAMGDSMRNIKRRWFLSPPLTEQDLISLGLRAHDKKPTPAGAPTARILPEVIRRGQASLTIRFEYVEGNAGDSANKARRLYYKVVPQGGEPPATPDDLPKSEPANRSTETIRFDYGDSGKLVYLAVQLENGKLKGPFGPMISAVIP